MSSKNQDPQAARGYHNRTKHSYQSVLTNRHFLDWDNQPRPFKVYTELAPIPLPEPSVASGLTALSAIAAPSSNANGQSAVTRQHLADILFYSAGITRRRTHAGGQILFRAAACTGALYHIDLYLVSGELTDLDSGVYHFAPDDFALRRLRKGDYRSVVVRASGGEPAVAAAPVVFVTATTYWRNSWKYQARAYRHCYWDSGTILANLLAITAARQLPVKIVAGFQDGPINDLLGLDTKREAALTLIPVGRREVNPPPPSILSEPLRSTTLPLSEGEVDYPLIRDMHEASSLESPGEVQSWRGSLARTSIPGGAPGRLIRLHPQSQAEMPNDSIEAVIRRRGSTRQFAREAIDFEQLSTIILQSTRGVPGDFLDNDPIYDLYCIVNAVHGIPNGSYVFHRGESALELLSEGDYRCEAGHLGLGQEIPADASVDLFFLVDLERVLKRFGNRGYRVAQLESAVTAGKFYLAAYAQHLGASGLTFFDDDVTDFFSPHAAGKSVMFLLALGKTLKGKHR